MPKRKTAAVEPSAANSEAPAVEVKDNEQETSPKKGKDSPKKAADGRGRGRPPLSNEEKAKRDAVKETKSARGRGRPKGSASGKKTTKGEKKK